MLFLVLRHDEYPENPRSWDNLGTIVAWHHRYNLGDEHKFRTPDDFLEWAKGQKMAVMLPLYAFEHGNIYLSLKPFHDPWDSGQIGWVYVTQERARKEYGGRLTHKRIQHLREVLEGELEEYNYYLTGQVYGFNLWEFKDNPPNLELVDSCYGFYGSDWEKNGLVDAVPAVFRPHLQGKNDEVLVEDQGQVTVWPRKKFQHWLNTEAPAEWIHYSQLQSALAW